MLTHNLLLLLTLSASNLFGNFAYLRRLVGGNRAEIISFPYLVQIEVKKKLICSGVIINETTILSTAHSFEKGLINGTQIRAGTSVRGGLNSDVVDIIQIENHQDFGKHINPYDYDISILWLAKPLKFSDVIQPIILPKRTDSIPKNVEFCVPGWGVEQEGSNTFSDHLKFIKIIVIDWNICNKLYDGIITKRMVCARHMDGTMDACQGDSGGALVYMNTLYGIVSWGLGCGQYKFPGLYTNIIVLRDWIQEKSGL